MTRCPECGAFTYGGECASCGWHQRGRTIMHANFARDESCRWCNPAQVCRECRETKHGACNGSALVDDGMNILEVDCLCASGGRV